MPERRTDQETPGAAITLLPGTGAGDEQPGAVTGYDSLGVVTRAGDEARGLSPNQRRFLALRLLYATDVDCATVVGVHRNTVLLWKAEPEFAAALNDLWAHGLEEWAKAERKRLLGKALAAAEDLLDATAPIRTKDGVALDGDGKPVLVADNQARAKGVELVARMNGLWAPDAATPQQSEGAALFGEMAAILKLRREAMEREQQDRRSPVVEGQVVVRTDPSR